VSALAISPHDSFVISGGDDAVVHVWRLLDILAASSPNHDVLPSTSSYTSSSSSLPQANSTLLHHHNLSPVHTWTDHVLPITHVHCAHGGRVFTSSLDRTAKIWDLPSGRCVASFTCPSYINVCVPDPMEHRLFLGAGDGRIYVVHLHAAAAAATAVSARRLYLHHPSRSTSLESANPSSSSAAAADEIMSHEGFIGHEYPVTRLVVSLCGQFVLSGDDDGAVRVWDSVSRQALRTMTCVQGSITDMVLVPKPEGLFHSVPKRQHRLAIAPFKKYISSSSSVNISTSGSCSTTTTAA
jgi:pre-rRNA-processing protein IPI3